MKYIQKGAEPAAFADWKARANEDWQPSYGALSGPPKQALKQALMAEQGVICCYCERRLSWNDSHIEHFRPQHDQAVDPLDFGNLLCSCQSQVKKGEPRHCGSLKDQWFDQRLLISPLKPDCEERFRFTGDGEIKPARETDEAARTTITRLGLDIPKLNALRAKVIEPFLAEELSVVELRAFVSGYLELDASGCYGEFWTTIRYLFANGAAP
ncbi:MAG: TIGR02646 family protein [Gammaproteobacteria bacterium]|nr:TIGR02646 family protein [Gammaproteobacteria bacterium]